MYLSEFFNYKNKLMEDLLTSEKVVKLVKPEIDFEDANTLAYTHIFPYEQLPSTTEDGRTYICFDVDIERVYNKTFLAPVIYIWVFSHQSALRLPKGGVRTDELCAEITEILDGSRYYGLGELNLYSVKRFSPMTDYQGKCLTFRTKEYNRDSPTGKPIPTRRAI